MIQRDATDNAAGLLYAYDGAFGTAAAGNVLSWSLYAGSTGTTRDIAGHQITPVILDQSTPGGWTITGIGATQTVSGPSSYTFSVDLVSGSTAVGPSDRGGARFALRRKSVLTPTL